MYLKMVLDSPPLRTKEIPVQVVFALAILVLSSCGSLVDDCCKTCRDGKACGDACIPKGSTCTKSGGCACDE